MLSLFGFFIFALGACIGSFLNVVVYRLPRVELEDNDGLVAATVKSMRFLSYPPSHCPKCDHKLGKTENIPILGWILLGGKCRHCKVPISGRYPIIETLTAVLFLAIFTCVFVLPPMWGPPTPTLEVSMTLPVGVDSTRPLEELAQAHLRPDLMNNGFVVDRAEPDGPFSRLGLASLPIDAWLRQSADLGEHWPMLVILLTLASCLLAASLIDAEHFIIPRGLSFLPALVAVPIHTFLDEPFAPLSLTVGPVGCAWAAGGIVGLGIALLLLRFGLIRRSFADGMPALEHEIAAADSEEEFPEFTRGDVTREMLWELAFVLPIVLLGAACACSAVYGPYDAFWQSVAETHWAAALLGSLLGGIVGAGVIWGVRIFGSLLFGREAMGLGDVDLMFGVGCCLGAAPAGIALFPAAIVGLAFAAARFFVHRTHEMPFGPYLAIASLALIALWNPLADYFAPAMQGLAIMFPGVAPLLGL